MNKFNVKKYQGNILIGLMLSLSLGLMLIMAFLKIYLEQQLLIKKSVDLIANQTEASWILELLAQEIKQTGFTNCRRIENDFTVNSRSGLQLTAKNTLTIKNNELILQYMGFPTAVLYNHPTHIITTLKPSYKIAEWLIIADCEHAEIFQIAHIAYHKQQQMIYPTLALQYAYATYAEIAPLKTHKFFIQEQKLIRADIYNRKKIIHDHIRKINFKYGIYHRQGLKFISPKELPLNTKIHGILIELQIITPAIEKKWFKYVALV